MDKMKPKQEGLQGQIARMHYRNKELKAAVDKLEADKSKWLVQETKLQNELGELKSRLKELERKVR